MIRPLPMTGGRHELIEVQSHPRSLVIPYHPELKPLDTLRLYARKGPASRRIVCSFHLKLQAALLFLRSSATPHRVAHHRTPLWTPQDFHSTKHVVLKPGTGHRIPRHQAKLRQQVNYFETLPLSSQILHLHRRHERQHCWRYQVTAPLRLQPLSLPSMASRTPAHKGANS